MRDREMTTLRVTTAAAARRVTYRTRGQAQGPITRLVSPSQAGELIKPFVFLDYFDINPGRSPTIGFHPHSGIATLTLLLKGKISYEETSGTKGVIEAGDVEWMLAAGGVWHTGAAVGAERAKGYQLWIALPPELESIEADAQYLERKEFQSQGPARVILGRHGEFASKVSAPRTINYLDVALRKGEKWRYQPPDNHTVAWIAVHAGKLAAPATADRGELVVFEESNRALEFEAQEDAAFILGSSVKHPHELVLGYHSVHTHKQALDQGEAKIAEIGRRLQVEGRL
jgi:redox-sensitive bicupin YhaK (pirin superfamily)